MVELISTYGVATVLIILLIGIPALVNFIKWCKGLWATRENFKQENIEKGKAMEARAEAKEARLEKDEAHIKLLEDNLTELKKIAAEQQKQINLLVRSDELDIKSWIKTQHEIWIPKKCIDSQTLDILEQRFAIYQEEGGNSWAKKLVDELRALPVVTIVPIQDIHDESRQQ